MMAKLKAAASTASWWICGPGATGLVFFVAWALTKDLGTSLWAIPAGGLVSLAMTQRE